jgi:hypothetical protein
MAIGIAFYHIHRVWNHRSSSELSINIHPLPDQRMPPKLPTHPKVYSIDHYTSELSINIHYGTWSWLLPHLPILEPPKSSPSSEVSIHIHYGTWYRLLSHPPSLEPLNNIHYRDWTRLFLSEPSLGQKANVVIVVRNDNQVYFCCLLVRELRREPSMLIQ